ncbi:HTH domain-containing protein [Sporosarcina sp. PTS2304]|uniref:HTH domain-containing protein n=1 Tax=Sporosarcina sp. PTS2304 TaxID=2283194 RepID=UPI000E0DDD15|nr:HTH domain-containing protein [Sporosarcina sp. PTS2304]AXI00581.1 HTH domain-containing protein [Sporosarcina sp. PTS2304]
MKVTIALVGSTAFCLRTEAMTLPKDIRIHCYSYENPSEAPHLLEKLKPCHAILFSGSLPYEASSKVIQQLTIPSFYLQQNENTIAVTLLYIASEKKLPIHELSIDSKEKIHVEHVLQDMNHLSIIKKPAMYELNAETDLQTVVNFHVSHYNSGQTKMAVTSVHAVYDQLQKIGIPAFRMIDPVSNILRALEHTAQQAQLQKSEATKIAVGLLKIYQPAEFASDTIERLATFLHAQTVQEDDTFLLYTTVGSVEFALQTEEFIQLIDSLSPISALMFGSGQTIVEASTNASSALELSRQSKNSGIYMLDEKKRLHGPLPTGMPAISMKIEEPHLLEISSNTTLSPAVISKLIQFNQFRQAAPFSANDLANYLGVSRRTAERTIKKLSDCEFIKTVGEEMTYAQGRPRSIYELHLPL